VRENIDPNTADTKYGRTHCGVLPWLSWCGGKGLLERERINPNIADTQYGRTPLGSAAMGGHEGRVKLLLEREDINPNTPEIERSLSPLEYTTNGRHEGVVKWLLESKDINPNIADTIWQDTAPVGYPEVTPRSSKPAHRTRGSES